MTVGRLVGLVNVVGALLVVAHATAGEIADRNTVDRQWNEHMLAGTSTHGAYGLSRSIRIVPGSVFSARFAERGIYVSDLSGTRVLGLVRGVGWAMAGGLLGRVDTAEGPLELYGKTITRWRGGFLGLDTYHRPQDVSFEFFLLRRPIGAAPAVVARTWTVPPDAVEWTYPIDADPVPGVTNTPRVRGFVAYDAASNVATVTVTGLAIPFVERVPLEVER
jgi:hypothetical protein